jgi:poly(A) polymerase
VTDARENGPRILERPDHPVSRENISRNTVKVLYRLHKSGYKAYMVGGSVRDLMLEREPKDFDVSTDARPEEVRRLFRNSRIIGRRFRLVHVYFRGEVVEVATFRREPDPEHQKSGEDELLITSDNTYGTPREDAFRRDFTINALFYNIADFSVLDYVGGLDDLEAKMVRTIGDPEVRFREDPVRMLRACEFAGRLGFDIDRESQKAIRELAEELEKASPARLTEEVIQLMRCGSAATAAGWMLDLGLAEELLPELYALEKGAEEGPADLSGYLPAVDRMVRAGRELSDIVLLALLQLPAVLVERHRREIRSHKPMSRRALEGLIEKVLQPVLTRFTISKVRAQHIQLAIFGFLRLCEPEWTEERRVRFARKPYFEDSLVLFEVMVKATGEGKEALQPWRQVAAKARSEARTKKGKSGRRGRPGGRRRGRRRGGKG